MSMVISRGLDLQCLSLLTILVKHCACMSFGIGTSVEAEVHITICIYIHFDGTMDAWYRFRWIKLS